jgi:hypothetical protein
MARVKKADRGVARQFTNRQKMQMNEIQYRRIQDALIKHDFVVTEYENKWGIDRLQELVSEELRERYYQQRERLNTAIENNDGKQTQAEVEVMCRAYVALEKEAVAMGHKPLSGDYWETIMPDGRVLAITKNHAEAGKVKRDNRELVVFSIQEIANILDARHKETVKFIDEVKNKFDGAVVTAVTPVKQEPLVDDEIPF